MMLKAIFFDLSGVLYTGRSAISGAVEAIDRVQASSLHARFVTNTSHLMRARSLEDLHALHFDIGSPQLFSAPSAALASVQQHHKRPDCPAHRSIVAEFAGLDQSNSNAVIIGDAANDFNYANFKCLFGLILTAIAVEAIANALRQLFPVLGGAA